MAKKPLRVGFDLDGVLLYNPARIARPFVVIIKRLIGHQTKTKFFIPHTPLQKLIWKLFHYSSLFIAPGFKDIQTLVKEGKIEAVIITGRYAFLKDDFENWLKKINQNNTFRNTYLNEKNEQPHLFKKRTVESLKLDIFVEDNWDIVKKLKDDLHSIRSSGSDLAKSPKVFWIYNIFDRSIQHEYKFSSLKNAVAKIKELTN